MGWLHKLLAAQLRYAPIELNVDFKAAARISRRVDLKDVSLVELTATSQRPIGPVRNLDPLVEHECQLLSIGDGLIQVGCKYTFRVLHDGKELSRAAFDFRLFYALHGNEPASKEDAGEFAKANGLYNSWPFARELIYSLTSRMGFPPYSLPSLLLQPPQKAIAQGDTPKEPEKA